MARRPGPPRPLPRPGRVAHPPPGRGWPSSPPAPQPPPAFGPACRPPARHPYGEAAPPAPPGPPPGAAPLTLPPAPPSAPPAEPGAPDPAAGKTDGAGPAPIEGGGCSTACSGPCSPPRPCGLQTIVLTPDEVDDPITSSGVIGEEVRTSHFAVRVERVELARTFKKEKMFPVPAFPGQSI